MRDKEQERTVERLLNSQPAYEVFSLIQRGCNNYDCLMEKTGKKMSTLFESISLLEKFDLVNRETEDDKRVKLFQASEQYDFFLDWLKNDDFQVKKSVLKKLNAMREEERKKLVNRLLEDNKSLNKSFLKDFNSLYAYVAEFINEGHNAGLPIPR